MVSSSEEEEEESSGDTVKQKSMVEKEELGRKETSNVEEKDGGEKEQQEKNISETKVAATLSRQKSLQDQEEMAALGDLPDEIREMLKVSTRERPEGTDCKYIGTVLFQHACQ